ncbi:hypothetical protein [Sorangium sp. So ce1335]|uniref:hypothetical protein n=1 Tax=Sorangium sp. So ce1335 TaxID=3133335 RepID=UPI003F645B61
MVRLGPGVFKLGKTIQLDGAVSLFGAGMSATRLEWDPRGPDGQPIIDGSPAIKVHNHSRYEAGNFELLNKLPSTGTPDPQKNRLSFPANANRAGTGLLLTGTGFGTRGHTAFWRNVNLRNFHIGMQVGEVGPGVQVANSELKFVNLEASYNDIGVLLRDYNTLNINFDMVSMAYNQTGLLAVEANSVSVYGGSVGYNGIDFSFTPGGAFSVRDVRSEHSGWFVFASGTSAPTPVTIDGCKVAASEPDPDPSHPPLSIRTNGGALLNIRGCLLARPIGVAVPAAGQSLVLVGNSIGGEQPFLPYYAAGMNGLRYVSLGNVRTNQQFEVLGFHPYEVGHVSGGQKVSTLFPIQ